MQKGTVPYYNVKSYLVYNICGICTIYTFKLRQFAKKLACTRVTAYIFGISTRVNLCDTYHRTDYKPTFISDKIAQNSKNKSMVVNTLWQIKVSGSVHQNI